MSSFSRKQIALILSSVFVASVFFLALKPHNASAISASQWKAGRIIDDAVFFNKDSMSTAQIQAFLVAKVPVCDTWGTQNTSRWNSAAGRYYTRAEWGAQVGNPAPFTCLKDYRENTTTHQSNYSNPVANIPGSISAAQIIYNVAQQYNINPQVFLVMLQKEQGLITDDWPYQRQYTYAMGANCPDTPSGCDPAYSGFATQVGRAGYLYNYYKNNINQFNFNVGNNYILWNVTSSGCGGGNVYIENIATAMLYIYTPYQPNTASLNSFPGQGDGCSSYGNRNFWYYFNNWFGSTIAPNYAWQPFSQEAYFDANKTIPADTGNSAPGFKYYVVVKAKNVGNQTWQKNQVNIGTSSPNNRLSSFYDNSWLINNRPATLKETQVAPGEDGTFEFWVKAPSNIGSYKEYFNLVAEGITWMNDIGLYYSFNIKPPNYSWQLFEQSAYTDQTKSTIANLTNTIPNSKYYLRLRVKNTGNLAWLQSFTKLGTSNQKDRSSTIYDNTWNTATRPDRLNEPIVHPGQFGTFEFWVKAPSNIGSYKEYFNLVAEGITWMNDIGLYYSFNIKPPNYSWQHISQNVYTSSSKSVVADQGSLARNTRYYLTVNAKNTGNTTWQNNIVKLGTSNPKERFSDFDDAEWLTTTRPTNLLEATVLPGSIGTFEFWIKTPNDAVTSKEYFNLLAEGTTWMNELGLNFDLKVN